MHTFVDVKFTSIVHEHQQERKFLGKIIYENLSWKLRITSICDKVAKIIGILSKSRRYLPSVICSADCSAISLFKNNSTSSPGLLG